ncbi:MAG: hypothetical protein Q9191_005921 [Dirinaria sp. TL-2023a]
MTLSVQQALPALRDGSKWIGGFRNIVKHLSETPDRHWDLDSNNFSATDKADITAFSAFVEAHGQPLLDLSLYVSSENYTTTTRPALSCLLQWPAQWFISPQKRASAKARTEYLGFSALDLDAVTDEPQNPALRSASDNIPQSLRVPKQTITGAIEKQQHAARFRLDALADAFFEPLQEMLGDKRYMLSEDTLSSLDCVALSYLALMLVPPVPHKWLAETMMARYPGLCLYVKRLSKDFFGGPVQVDHALIGSDGETLVDDPKAEEWQNSKKLPWGKPAERGPRDAGSTFLAGMVNSLPFADHLGRDDILIDSADTHAYTSTSAGTSSLSSIIIPSVLALGSMAAAVGGYLLYSNVRSDPAPQRKSLSQMGEAGSMLGMGVFGYNPPVSEERPREDKVPVGLEVDVEVEENTIR